MRSLFIRIALTIALTIALLAGASGPTQAAIVSVSPTQQTAGVGASILVYVTIADLLGGAVPSLGAFDIDVDYDPAILSFTGFSFGTGLDVIGLGSQQIAATASAGQLNFFELSFDDPDDLHMLQPDAFTLFTLMFQTVGAGTSALALEINALSDAHGAALAASTVNGSVNVVPLPATGWLLLSSLLALTGFIRRRSA